MVFGFENRYFHFFSRIVMRISHGASIAEVQRENLPCMNIGEKEGLCDTIKIIPTMKNVVATMKDATATMKDATATTKNVVAMMKDALVLA